MIITMTGKPCSGKDTVLAYLAEKYNFEKFTAGAIYRKVATERGMDVLSLNRKHDTSVDKLVDDEIKRIGKERLNDDLIMVSRTAWMFLPEAFNVFLDIDEDEQVRRMRGSGRTDEIVDLSEDELRKAARERFDLENKRYLELYGYDNKNPDNYDLVVNTTTKTPEEVGEIIMENYKKYVENRKK